MVEKYSSMHYGSDATYFGNESFRVRVTADNILRIHFPTEFTRERDEYIAVDLNPQEFMTALIAASAAPKE